MDLEQDEYVGSRTMYDSAMHKRVSPTLQFGMAAVILVTGTMLSCAGERNASKGDAAAALASTETDPADRLRSAIEKQNLEELQVVLREFPHLVSHRFEEGPWLWYVGPTPLMYAAACGWNEGVDVLLASGASLFETTCDGVNAIIFAMRVGDTRSGAEIVDFVERCVEAGVSASARTPLGWTALHGAAHVFPDSAAERAVSVLHRAGAEHVCEGDVPPIFYALHECYNMGAVRGIAAGYPSALSCRNSEGDTPLQSCIREGELGGAYTLLVCGADATETGVDGSTMLHSIAQRPYLVIGLQEVVQGIIARSREILDDVNQQGWTALHLSILSHSPNALRRRGVPLFGELLLDAGADPNSLGLRDKTPLHLACERAAKEWVVLLLGHDANPYAVDEEGVRPIDLLENLAEKDPLWHEVASQAK